ncbi:MAG TPA: LysR substrate-binding domain-containing protein [Phycisphaerae bacterium]|nr:LysR substrate-binding domain-containing protein [Phycisphaerae bacterium]
MDKQIEIRHLKGFLATAEELHVTRAAKRLGISQPTLSQTIHDLERIIGMPLFDRIGRHIGLTDVGESLLNPVRRILQDIGRTFDDMISDLRGGRSGSLRVGLVPILLGDVLPSLIAAYHREFPQVQLFIENGNSRVIQQRLLTGLLDFGMVFGDIESDELITESLYVESFMLGCSRDNPLVKKNRIRLVDLLRQPLVITPKGYLNRRLLEAAAQKMGLKLQVAMEINDVQIMMDVAARSHLVTVVTAHAGREQPMLAVVPIVDPELTYQANLVWHRDQYRTEAARNFAARLKSALIERVTKYSMNVERDRKNKKKAGPNGPAS